MNALHVFSCLYIFFFKFQRYFRKLFLLIRSYMSLTCNVVMHLWLCGYSWIVKSKQLNLLQRNIFISQYIFIYSVYLCLMYVCNDNLYILSPLPCFRQDTKWRTIIWHETYKTEPYNQISVRYRYLFKIYIPIEPTISIEPTTCS